MSYTALELESNTDSSVDRNIPPPPQNQLPHLHKHPYPVA